MNKFHQCPRCDKRYWFKRYYCVCSFFISTETKVCYTFKTPKYEVMVFSNYSLILRKPLYAICVSRLPKKLPPKTTDEEIEKYLALL
jgi:hypothetical protein